MSLKDGITPPQSKNIQHILSAQHYSTKLWTNPTNYVNPVRLIFRMPHMVYGFNHFVQLGNYVC